MTPTEIILLVIAIVVLVLSFVIVDKSNSLPSGGKKGNDKGNTPVLTDKEIKELKKQAAHALEAAVSESVIEADDKMSKISNEKIMAVNEFSSQLLEKIEQNNDQVVFLYNMLTQKEEEIKTMYSKMDTIRRENKEFLDKLSTLMSAKSKGKHTAKETDHSATEKPSENKEQAGVNQQANGLRTDDDTKIVNNDTESFTEQEVIEEAAATAEDDTVTNKNEQILQLHKQNKSILEISKELNLGQGEVKLVIDLYGR